MAKVERGLGKGLSALLGGEMESANFRKPVQYVNANVEGRPVKNGDMMVLNIADVEPNQSQPRVTFDQTALEELAESIRTLGVIQPITVRCLEQGRYQIISGERRYRASKMAGLATIPAYVRTASDDAAVLEMAIVENVQREDLDPIETAVSYQRLIDECHLTQEQMAARIGKSRVSVTNFMRLLKLPAKVQYDLKQGNISVGHAKVLLGLEDMNLQEKLCDIIIRDGLSVRGLEDLIRTGLPSEPGEKTERLRAPKVALSENCRRVEDALKPYFSGKVNIRRSAAGSGCITLRFKNDSQLEEFLKLFPQSQE